MPALHLTWVLNSSCCALFYGVALRDINYKESECQVWEKEDAPERLPRLTEIHGACHA